MPRWRRGLAALNMGLSYDSTGGGLLYGADGQLMDGCCCEESGCCDGPGSSPAYAHITVTGTSDCAGCYSSIDFAGTPDDSFTLSRLSACRYILDAPYSACTARSHFRAPDCLDTEPGVPDCDDPITCTTDRIHVELEMGYLVGSPTLWRVYGQIYKDDNCDCCASGISQAYPMFFSVFYREGFTMGTCVDDGTTVVNLGDCFTNDFPTFVCADTVASSDLHYTAFIDGSIAITLSDTP